MIEIKKLEEILRELQTTARIVFPELDTSTSSILHDILFKIHAYAGQRFYEVLDSMIEQIDFERLSGSKLDEEAKIYGIERSPGKNATGTVTFYTLITPPTSGFYIPKGTRVLTRTGLVQLGYLTVKDAVIYASDFVSDTNRYEKEVEVIAENPGKTYNIGPGLIGIIATPIANIHGVTNYDFISGGTDPETDDELREIIRKRKIGRNLGTRAGLESRVEIEFDLPDSNLVSPEDPDSERSLGSDLFVIYTQKEQTIDTFVFHAVPPITKFFRLTKQPVLKINEVKINGVPTIDFVLHKDTGPNRESYIAEDEIEITGSLNDNDIITVDYDFTTIDKIQQFVDARENSIPSLNLLIKRGNRYKVNMTLQVSFIGNVIIAEEQQKIISALSLFLEQFDLGQPLDKSDIVATVERGFSDIMITSVDSVIVQSFQAVSDYGEIINPVNERISVNSKSYLRIGTVSFI